MSDYHIVWRIDIEADSARDAAQKARQFQLDPDSTATCFNVSEGNREPELIDIALGCSQRRLSRFVDMKFIEFASLFVEPTAQQGCIDIAYDELVSRYTAFLQNPFSAMLALEDAVFNRVVERLKGCLR